VERLKEKYQKEVAPALTEKFGYKNVMQLPKVEKVIINMGVGEAVGSGAGGWIADHDNKGIHGIAKWFH